MADSRFVPQEVHLIWYGSSLPETQANRIKENKPYLDPNYKINLWYDPKILTPEQIEKLKGQAQGLGAELRDISDVYNKAGLSPAQIQHAEYESAGPFPNYAARSDQDRLLILSVYGGIYMDTDILVKKLLELLRLDSQEEVLFNQTGEGKQYIGNDLFASSPENRLIKEIYEAILKKYSQSSDNIISLQNFVTNAFNRTLLKSGPPFLREFLYGKELTDNASASAKLLNSALGFDPDSFGGGAGLSWLEGRDKKRLRLKDYTNNMEGFIRDIAIRVSYEINANLINGNNGIFLEEYLRYAPAKLSAENFAQLNKLIEERILSLKQQRTEELLKTAKKLLKQNEKEIAKINNDIVAKTILIKLSDYLSQHSFTRHIDSLIKMVNTFKEEYLNGNPLYPRNYYSNVVNLAKALSGDPNMMRMYPGVPFSREDNELLNNIKTSNFQFLYAQPSMQVNPNNNNTNRP